MQQSFEVEPIHIGAQSTVSIKYGPDVLAAMPLLVGRIKAGFKPTSNTAALLFTVDSNVSPASVVRIPLVDDPDGCVAMISLVLTSVQTALIAQSSVMFDVICFNGAEAIRVPGTWSWPVDRPITPIA